MLQTNSGPWNEIFSIAASAVSLVIAMVAIWLSITFYKMSETSSGKIREAADRINATVGRLETLFDKLYGDTFSMMKDTVSDMRKHIWSDTSVPNEAELRADVLIGQISSRFESEMKAVLSRQSSTDKKVSELGVELKRLLDEAITESRNVELQAREETTKGHILRMLSNTPNKMIPLGSLIGSLRGEIAEGDVIAELFRLHKENAIAWDGEPHVLRVNEIIRLNEKQGDLFEAKKS